MLLVHRRWQELVPSQMHKLAASYLLVCLFQIPSAASANEPLLNFLTTPIGSQVNSAVNPNRLFVNYGSWGRVYKIAAESGSIKLDPIHKGWSLFSLNEIKPITTSISSSGRYVAVQSDDSFYVYDTVSESIIEATLPGNPHWDMVLVSEDPLQMVTFRDNDLGVFTLDSIWNSSFSYREMMLPHMGVGPLDEFRIAAVAISESKKRFVAYRQNLSEYETGRMYSSWGNFQTGESHLTSTLFAPSHIHDLIWSPNGDQLAMSYTTELSSEVATVGFSGFGVGEMRINHLVIEQPERSNWIGRLCYSGDSSRLAASLSFLDVDFDYRQGVCIWNSVSGSLISTIEYGREETGIPDAHFEGARLLVVNDTQRVSGFIETPNGEFSELWTSAEFKNIIGVFTMSMPQDGRSRWHHFVVSGDGVVLVHEQS